MLNFVRLFIIRILSVFCVSLASILFIAHSSPPPSIATDGDPGFSSCHLPCWAGVTPYETAFQDALNTITTNLPGWSLDVQGNNSQFTFYSNHMTSAIGGMIYEDRGLVGRIWLDVSFPLWYLIEEFGKPYCVRANHLAPRNEDVVVVYWHLGDMSLAGIVNLEPSDEWFPGVLAEAILVIPSNEQCTLIDAFPWMGFAPLRMYQTEYMD